MNAIPAILKLDAGGLPVGWIRWQTAVVLYARDRVRWEAGDERFLIRGGTCAATGRTSQIEIGSIIAVSDRSRRFEKGVPLLTNRTLFQRDQNICLYCGSQFSNGNLTRDHVIPASRGGLSTWENCVTACRHCNQRKDDRTPEEASMKLLAIPYTPNLAEYLILQNRRILADQMAFLRSYARKQGVAPAVAA
ncbi:HNH endonuclease [Flagellatimonas centrodinii]|uniref:HNH endonuclease n=1 Tax=Flagellatimonas centrodinii TaxID=2806210 RepID=UPI001FEDCF55|nr:HNH endonuclease [Flagellatimonas centrodinii]ULQ46803.1 HNH endonuclease [Flagellatimonas centrodinii]